MLCALVGCYEHHVLETFDDRDGGRDVFIGRDASVDVAPDVPLVPLDVGPDAPIDAPLDIAIMPGCGFLPMCGRAPTGERLRMSLDGDLRALGMWATMPFVDEGEVRFVPGRFGQAVQLDSDAVVQLPATSNRLRSARALTFAFWLRELEQTDGKSFLRCRTFTSGFEIYRGLSPDVGNICVGSVSGGGACTGYPLPVHECWHHFVLRWSGGLTFEVFIDGSLAAELTTEAPIFDRPGNLTLGERAGGAARTGTLELDEVVVWDRALDDDEIFAAGCR